jgi:hypothetical protein
VRNMGVEDRVQGCRGETHLRVVIRAEATQAGLARVE